MTFPTKALRGSILLLAALALTAPSLRANSYENAVSYGGSKHPELSGYSADPMAALARKIMSQVEWNAGDGPITRLEIRIGDRKLYGYQGDKVALVTPISSGREGHATPPGHYSILDKDPEHKSSLYGSFVDAQGHIKDNMAQVGQSAPSGLHYEAAPMPWYLRVTDDGVGIHAGFVTGYPASHGCIRLPPQVAQELYPKVAVGTPVDVVP